MNFCKFRIHVDDNVTVRQIIQMELIPDSYFDIAFYVNNP